MMTTRPSSTVPASRLMRQLNALGFDGEAPAQRQFADKLGRLVDLSQAFALSDALRSLPRQPFNAADTAPADLRGQFAAARQAMITAISKSFAEPGAALPLPAVDAGLLDKADGFDAYGRFYAIQQSELEHRCLKLRQQLRQQLASISPRLAQLATLDSLLGDTISPPMRRFYALVPRLLAQRFASLRSNAGGSTPADWLAADGWLTQFYHDMQALLLAELELRLQPMLGLLEALDEETLETP